MEKSVRTPEKFGEDLQRLQISSEPGYAIQLKSGDSKYSVTREKEEKHTATLYTRMSLKESFHKSFGLFPAHVQVNPPICSFGCFACKG